MSNLKNLGLSCLVLLLLYGLLEYFSLSIFYHVLSPLTYPMVDDGIPVILQHNKASVVPHHYIALAGDSYAMGLGDDFFQQAGQVKARYGTAPFLQQYTGRDVISFGSGGNGSIAGMVAGPLSILAYLHAAARIALEDPDVLLVYFYEGNDLNDNIEYLARNHRQGKTFEQSRLNDPVYFQRYLQENVLQQDSLYQQAQQLHWYQQFYLGKFVWRSSAALLSQVPQLFHPETTTPAPGQRSPLNPPGRYSWTEPGSVNHALLNGRDVQLPDTVQGPSMDLTREEKENALVSFRESLVFLKHHLPKTAVIVVYVPSVISCYQISSTQVSLQSPARRKQFVFDTQDVIQQSDWIKQHIQEISEAEKVAFVDARPAIRAAAKQQSIHGPLDWNHFNTAGYRALTQAILPSLQTVLRPSR